MNISDTHLNNGQVVLSSRSHVPVPNSTTNRNKTANFSNFENTSHVNDESNDNRKSAGFSNTGRKTLDAGDAFTGAANIIANAAASAA